MRINEIFQSIQGEGVFAGVPTTFIRLQECNLRCNWCDTTYAQEPDGGELMSPLQVVNTLKSYVKGWYCITGGEPLLHVEDLYELVSALKRNGACSIEIETNGSFSPPKWFSLVDSWVADIKCPSSGVCGASKIDMWFSMRHKDQVKFVVATEEDLNFVRKTLKSGLCIPTILVSPVFPRNCNEGSDSICISAEWLQRVVEFCKEMDVRFSLQLHKVIWGNKQGV